MDPITLIVTALALGAAAGLKDTAAQTIKDAYSGIKALILRRYGDVGLDALEKKPESQIKRDSVAEDLTEAGAARDEELVLQAQALAQLVEQYAPNTAAKINVKLSDIKAIGNFRVSDLSASGSGAKIDVDAQRIEAGGDFEVTGLHSEGSREPDPKN
jgi:hypothetical protein